MKGRLFVVSGPSGTGKTTLCRKLLTLTDRLEYSVSYTTRLPRRHEVEGKDYFFVSEERFQKMIESGDFVEWARVYDNFYGTSKQVVDEVRRADRDMLFDVDIEGAFSIKEWYADAVLIYLSPPSLAELKNRLQSRGQDSEEIICKRLEQVKKELESVSSYNYVVLNHNLEQALKDLQAIITAERLKPDRSHRLIESLMQEEIPFI